MKLEWLTVRQLHETKKRVVQKTRIEARAPARPFIALIAASGTLAMAMLAWASSSTQIEQLDPLVVPRTAHTATVLADGNVLITGGRDAAGTALAAAEIFDPKTQISTLIGSLVTSRAGHTATLLKDGRVLIAGGINATGALASAEIFEPLASTSGFRALPAQMGAARTRHTATLLNNGKVLIAGGDSVGSAEIFDPATESFSIALLSMAEPRIGHTATLFSDETVLLAGGQTDSMEFFNDTDQTFTLDTHRMSGIRNGQEAIALSDTRLLFFGGDTDNTIEEFNLSADTLTLKGSMDAPASTATLLANGRILVLRPDMAGVYAPDEPTETAFATLPNAGLLQRSGNTATEIALDKKILVAGGVNANNQPVAPVALFNPARIWTDKDDYQPDDPVLLNGSGWKANEDVYLYAVDSETEQWTYGSTVTADANGEFAVDPYFIVELRHLGVTFDVTAVGAQSALTADVTFTDTSSQVTKIAFDRTGPTNFTSGSPNGVLGVQLQNSSNSSEKLTSNAANNFVTITITSNSSTGRFDTTSGGSFTATSLTQTIDSGSTTNPNFPDFYYKDTALGPVTLTAKVTAKGSGLSNLPLNTTATLAKTLLPGSALSVSPASSTFGGTVDLSATLTSGTGVSGKSIAFTLNGTSAGSATTNASGVATLSNASLSGINPGTYATGVGASFAGDSSFTSSSGTASLTVAKADQTINFAALPAKTYGDAPFTVSATASSGLAVSFSILSGPATIAGNTVTITGAGTVTVRASQAGNTNYNAAPNVDQPFNVAKDNTATVTLKSLSQTYDGTPKAATAMTKPSNLNVSFTYDGSPTAPTDAGSYTVVGTINDANYAGSATDTLVISKANQNIIFNPLPAKTYGDPPFTVSATASSGLTVSFSILSGPATISGNTVTLTGAGTVTVRASQAGNNNYQVANNVDRSFTVAGGAATVTLGNLNQTYDGTPKSATATTNPPNLNVTFTYNGSATAPINAGSYTVVGTVNDAGYTGSATGTLVIAKGTATVTLGSMTQIYNGTARSATATTTPSGLSVSFTYDGSAIAPTNAGSYAVVGTVNDNNYSGSATGTLVIGKDTATVQLGSLSQNYNGTARSATATTTPSGLSVSFAYDGSATAPTNAGSYAVVGTINDDNYSGSATGTLVVAKANATITVTAYDVTYDGIAHMATGSAKGIGDVTLTGLDLSGTTRTNAGTTIDTWTFTDVTGNYKDASSTVTDKIAKADAAITVTPYDVIYNSAEHTAAGSVTGIGGVSLSGLNLNATKHTNAGTYTDTWTFTDVTGNYKDASSTVSDKIAKTDATITVTPYDVTYDGNPHTATGSATGVGGVSLAGLDLSGTTRTNAGTTIDTWTFTDVTGNYKDANSTVTDKIAKADATITVTPYDVIYNGAEHTATGSVTGVGGVSLSGLNLNATKHTNAGTYTDTWTFTDVTGNYKDASSTVSDKIAKADATITVTHYDVTYDGNPHTATGSATGVGGVSLAGLDLSGTTRTNAGTTIDTWTFTDVTGNYKDAGSTVTDKIAKADATITITPYDVTYDGNPHTASGSAKGVKNETLSGLDLSGTTRTNAGTTIDTWTFTDVTGNYKDASSTVTDKIAKADATITITPYDVTYDGNPHTATGSAKGVKNETLSGLDLSGTTRTNAGTTIDTWTFIDVTGNYIDASSTVTDKIARADATIHVTPYHVTYDVDPHTATGTATGVKGEDLTSLLDLSGTTHTNAGTYNGDAWSFAGDINYNNTSAAVDDQIDKAKATITVTSYHVTYDGDAHTATGSAAGVKGEALTGLGLSGTTHTGAGAYATDAWSFTNQNYKDDSGTVADQIDRANATIIITPYSVTYDGNLHTATGSATGVKGESLSGLNLSGAAHTNAGTYLLDAWCFTDVTGNYKNAGSTIIDIIARADATITVTPYSVTYDGLDHTATGSAKGVKNETLTGLDPSGTKHKNAGAYNGDAWSFTDVTGNYNNTSGTVNDSIGQAKLTITAGVGTGVNFTKQFTKQYSDPITFTVQYAGFVNGEIETVLGGTLTFNSTAVTAQFLAPGTYTITPSGLTSGNYNICYVTGTLTETQEDARSTYTGAMFASTSSATSSTATVTLSATIQDITAVTGDPAYDAYPGDIRKATVTFVNRDNNNEIIAANVPVGLVSSGDTKTGTATVNWSVNIGSADSTQFTIGIIVNGYYTRDNSFDDTVVTVSKAIPGSITGGGYLVLQSSAGLVPGGVGTKNNFGFNVKTASNGPKGNINTIIRNNGRVYQIKGNAMTSLVTKLATVPSATTPSTATFNGKANIQDITNPLAPISVDGNATLQVQMTDKGEPGSSDSIAITVWNKSGGLWFSSNWSSTKTVEQILGGGNLVVR